MAFNLKKVVRALLLSSSQPLAIKDIQDAVARFHEQKSAMAALLTEAAAAGHPAFAFGVVILLNIWIQWSPLLTMAPVSTRKRDLQGVVLELSLPPALPAEIVAAAVRGPLRPRIGGIADVIIVGSGRIDRDKPFEARAAHVME